MPQSDKRERHCGPAGTACALGFSIFLVGGVIGLILYLTDTGGAILRTITDATSGKTSPDNSVASILNPTCTQLGRTGSQCDQCDAGFWGPNCTACPLCGTHGACDGSGTKSGTGACRCATGWTTSSSSEACDACAVGFYGPDCTPCPSCSGHGTCVDSGTHGTDGSCACASSNSSSGLTTSFAGVDCGDCAPGHYGPNCAKCPTDCGNHGQCADGMQGDGSCLCNPGFTGQLCDQCEPGVSWAPNSSVTCRLGPGLIVTDDGSYRACSGRGTLNSTTGQCTCDANVTGPGCETQVCEQDRFGEECGGTCKQCAAGQGVCDGAGTTFGTGACRCSGNFSGAECRHCKPGFTGASCNIACPGAGGTVCSGHGTCRNDGIASNTISSAGTCDCIPGFSGVDCSTESISTNRSCLKQNVNVTCSGRGVCQSNDTCICNEGWDAGTLCQDALPGWVKISDSQGVVSAEECPGGANNPCSGHGVCSDTGNTKGSCSCDEGYSGDACEMCAHGYFLDENIGLCTECPGGAQNSCNNQGVCHNTTGICMCATGWKDSSNCTECEDGFWGQRCYSCPRGLDLGTGVAATCSGHGTCSDGRLSSDGRCTCAAGFSGQACDLCDYGHFGPSCQACPTSSTGAVCSNQGVCDGDSTQRGSGKCLCFPRITGDTCDKCIPGHHGPDCAPCPGLDANNGGKPCSGHGVCSGAGERLRNGGTCTCEAGWRGTDCGEKIPCSDLNECNGHGECVTNTCYCHNGWAGDKCQTLVIEPDLCQPACSGLDEKCVNQRCQTTAPPSDPCATTSCSDGQGLCASGSCICHPGFEGSTCNSISPIAYRWEEEKPWSACSQACGGQPGIREREIGCWDATNGRAAASSNCPSPAPRRDEECRHFACNNYIGIAGIQLSLPERFINVSVLHRDVFEETLQAEIVHAAGMTDGTKKVQIVSTMGGLDGMATLVRFEIHPGDPAATVDEAIDSLMEQTNNPESILRTKGTFLRRLIDREGALNVVKIRVDTGASDGDIASSADEIDIVNPFVDLASTNSEEAPAPSATDDRNGHAGIAGIVVASSFLGVALIVSSVWYGMHRTKAGAKYKMARRESKGSSMKIQLTEAEKAEMGLHANPAHADSKSNSKVKEAVQMIKAAVAQDEAKNFQGAINLYQGAVDRFMVAMKFERNATYKFELAKKCDRYLVRIKQLKEYTANHPGSGSSATGGSASRGGADTRAPSVAHRSPSMVRAPVMK